MSSSDILPILAPFGAAIIAISMASFCCVRRQLVIKYRNLEERIITLEQKINQRAMLDTHIQPPQSQPQNLNTYAIYPNYQQPSAPYAQQPYNPYPITTQNYAI